MVTVVELVVFVTGLFIIACLIERIIQKGIAIYEHEWKIRILAKKYNVSRKIIRDIVNRKTWTHI